jgi:multicomponent Na+:H+ antiporter subunit E
MMHIQTIFPAKAACSRLFMAMLGWWALSEGVFREWTVAAVTILIAALASLLLWPAGVWRWRLPGLAGFVPYFLAQSVRGGVDVARRALSPSMPLNPGFMRFQLRLPAGPAQVWFVWIVSLLPGTVSAELDPGSLRVHVLDLENMPAHHTLTRLEERVAALFGSRLE